LFQSRHCAAGVLAIAPLLLGVTCGIGQEELEEATLSAELTGAAVIPPVETSATGIATGRLFGNTLRIQGEFTNLESPVLSTEEGGVLYRHGGEDVAAGGVILRLTPASVDGRTGSFLGDVLLDDDLVEEFLAGRTYVEVRTVDRPEGELRAQLRR